MQCYLISPSAAFLLLASVFNSPAFAKQNIVKDFKRKINAQTLKEIKVQIYDMKSTDPEIGGEVYEENSRLVFHEADNEAANYIKLTIDELSVEKLDDII